MIRAVGRIARLTALIEYHTDKYGALCDVPTAIGFGMHNIQILTRLKTLSATPTDSDYIGRFPSGGISNVKDTNELNPYL